MQHNPVTSGGKKMQVTVCQRDLHSKRHLNSQVVIFELNLKLGPKLKGVGGEGGGGRGCNCCIS